MTREGLLELLSGEGPELDCFIVRGREQRAPVWGKGHGANAARVRLDHRRLALAASEIKGGVTDL